jgi:hypothetical protein
VGPTAITFDDLSSLDPVRGSVPPLYQNLTWKNIYFTNASSIPYKGHPYALGPYGKIGFAVGNITIRLPKVNRTLQLNSCMIASLVSNLANVSIIGYFYKRQIYSTTLTISNTAVTRAVFNWPGLNKIVMMGSNLQLVDIGIDNLWITF